MAQYMTCLFFNLLSTSGEPCNDFVEHYMWMKTLCWQFQAVQNGWLTTYSHTCITLVFMSPLTVGVHLRCVWIVNPPACLQPVSLHWILHNSHLWQRVHLFQVCTCERSPALIYDKYVPLVTCCLNYLWLFEIKVCSDVILQDCQLRKMVTWLLTFSISILIYNT